jgi:hypothetical protein
MRGGTMAGMARTQFTLRTLLTSVAYFAIACGSLRAAFVSPELATLFPIGTMFVGAATGVIFGKEFTGLAVGGAIGLMLSCAFLIATTD